MHYLYLFSNDLFMNELSHWIFEWLGIWSFTLFRFIYWNRKFVNASFSLLSIMYIDTSRDIYNIIVYFIDQYPSILNGLLVRFQIFFTIFHLTSILKMPFYSTCETNILNLLSMAMKRKKSLMILIIQCFYNILLSTR